MVSKIRIGTRKSELAMVQTRWVKGRLNELYPDIEIDIVSMDTIGDKIIDVALSKIGEKSLFTKELEAALESGMVDMIVHSLKDLPTALPPGMVIGAVCEREDPRDALVMRFDLKDKTLATLENGSRIGTSSVRRTAQLKRRCPYLQFLSVRGNLNTRLRKLDNGHGDVTYDALVLAAAGLERMGWHDRISQLLGQDECMYAVGQGALAVECRTDDTPLLALLSALAHAPTTLRCVAERALLMRLEGGCSAPVAVWSELDEQRRLKLMAGCWSLDGQQQITSSATHQFICDESSGIKDDSGIGDHSDSVSSAVNNVSATVGLVDSASATVRSVDSASDTVRSVAKREAEEDEGLLTDDDDGCSTASPAKRARREVRSYVGVYGGHAAARLAEAEALGLRVAQQLLDDGAGPVLAAAKAQNQVDVRQRPTPGQKTAASVTG